MVPGAVGKVALMRLLPGTRALITGASRGIGAALARELARRGAVVGVAARSTGELDALVASLPGDGHLALECDVASRASVGAALERFVAHAGGLDLLVANAGITHYEPFLDAPVEAAERMTQVNWLGTVYTVHAGLEPMVAAGAGHVVVVSSGAALRAFPSAAVYGATKAAQRAFAEALRHELHGTGVSLTTVYPGEVATSLHDHEKDRMPAWYRGGPGAASADVLAAKILAAVEADDRALFFPPWVRLLGILNGATPRAADLVLRRLRGSAAAPRRD
jgi:short-subunit dehydrogenase